MPDNAIVKSPYDDAFRTLVNDCSKLVIPLINEAFGENYNGTEIIQFYPNEHFLNQQDGNEKERITDTSFVIIGKETKRYHLECQSTADSSMLIRIFEYDTQIALDQGSSIEGNELRVSFPNTGLLYLRSTSSTPDAMWIVLCAAGQELRYKVPVMKVKNYSIEEIFEKNLLFLIPFYIFTYESRFDEIESDERKLEELEIVYQGISEKLEELALKETISEYYKKTIMDMSERVLVHLARSHENILEGVGRIMVGQVLDYEAKRFRNQVLEEGREEGRKEGREEGREEGRKEGREEGFIEGRKEGETTTLVSLYKQGFLTAENAGKAMGTTEEAFLKLVAES